MTSLVPLSDITSKTNVQVVESKLSAPCAMVATEVVDDQAPCHTPVRYRHDPYWWPYLAAGYECADAPIPSRAVDECTAVCIAVVQHKCHMSECVSSTLVGVGQYVVVHGDRGVDVGVIVRVRTKLTAPVPSLTLLRYATQREVDFWATELKAMEAAALDYCRRQVQRHSLPMDVRHAEYQFDQKKLTFYYGARQRVDFVAVLRELYREFGCRIWMEKV